MYDPARDLFQPTEDAVSPATTEPTQSPAVNEVKPEQALDTVAKDDHDSQTPPATMSSEVRKKRQRSPSLASERGQTNTDAPLAPPDKKRRSSVEPQSAEFSEAKGSSSGPDKYAEATPSHPAAKGNPPTDNRGDTKEASPSKKTRNGEPVTLASQPGDQSIDRYETKSRNERRDGERGRSRQFPTSRRTTERRTSPSRRYRSRSPRRRRSPAASTASAYSRRDPIPPPRRSRSPSPIPRSPPRDDQSLRRPGGGTGRGRNVLALAQQVAEQREREQQTRNVRIQRERGVQHMSNQFYNARPEWVKERGREWRKNESKIKGLRAFNNWVKSCIIQKFSPEEAPQVEELGWGEEPKAPAERKPLLVLDIGCGKGGDLGKWQLAPQAVGLYVGLDPADQSVEQARDRYSGMRQGRKPIFDGRFHVKDCFGEWIGDVPIVKEVGIDPNAGSGGPSKWSGGGFDVVTMMFSMHYAFESEQKAKMMLRNVAGSLKKGGRFIGVVPNSDAISERVVDWWKAQNSNNKDNPGDAKEGKGEEEEVGSATTEPTKDHDQHQDARAPNWGNNLYTVRFTPPSGPSAAAAASSSSPSPSAYADRPTPPDGIFRDPPFGWKYMYWMEEAVDVPEYVVPWEAFRALAEGYNLEQRYRKPFLDIWQADKDQPELKKLSFRMGVRKDDGSDDRGGGGLSSLAMSDQETEAAGLYHAFCFVKV